VSQDSPLPLFEPDVSQFSTLHCLAWRLDDVVFPRRHSKLRDTLNNLLLKQPQNWQTTVGLPFFRIESTVVEWDEIKYDVRLLQRVPYEGVSRMQTSLRRRHRDRVVRHGVGMIIESDFYATEAGRKHFADQLTSIRYCVQETCNYDVLYAYLTCSNYDFRYDLQKSLRPRRNVKTAMQHEIAFYGIVQKEGLGMDKAIEDSKYRMKRYGVEPDLLCVPPQLLLYMALAPEEKILYKEGGPSAVANFEAGVEGYKTRQYRGMGVVTSDPFEITDDVEAVQMLQRSTQVGEFYVMGPPTIPFGKKDNFQNFMDIVIFDEEADRHVVIPWEDAVEATFAHFTNASTAVGPASDKLVQTGGALATAGTKSAAWIAATAYRQTRTWDRPAGGYAIAPFEAGMNSLAGAVATSTAGLTVADWRALANCWHYINRNGTEGVTVTTINGAGDAYIETPGCFPTTQFELNGDLNDPFHIPFEFRGGSIQDFMQISEFRINLVVARPFIEHVMHSAVMTVSGRDTGAMLFGPSDMQISANTQVKTIEGHYTGHFKAVINKPQNVFVMRDVACASYVAGGNATFFGYQSGRDIKNRYSASLAKQNIMRRLSFAEDIGYKYDSMMAFPLGARDWESGKLDTVMSVTRRMLPWEIHTNDINTSFPGGQVMFDAYRNVLGLDQIHFGEDTRAVENNEYVSQGATNNALCFLGPHRKFSRVSRSMFELVSGQGHFGPDALPGDARWRRGEAVSQKSARDQMISLEAVASSQLAFGPR